MKSKIRRLFHVSATCGSSIGLAVPPILQLCSFIKLMLKRRKLDCCIVWNAHNTVLGSKRLAICATV